MIKEIFSLDNDFIDLLNELSKNVTIINEKEIYDRYYYHGEFGFFHVTILGALEKFFKTTNKKIIINAHTNFIKILEILFPNNIIGIPITKLEKNREYHNTPNIESPDDSMDLAEFLKIDKSLVKNIKYITQPITYYTEKLEEKYNNNYVVIFPRNREGRFSHRNMSISVFNNIVKILNKYNYEIICVGHPEEVLDEVKKKFIYIDNLEETIYLLNNTKLLIAPDSGFIDFGKNCATKNILMVYNKSHINYHHIFSPFKSNFNTVDVSKSNYEIEIDKYLLSLLN